jgi:hypothetical protein
MHKTPNTSFNSSKTLQKTCNTRLEKRTRRPIELVSTRKGKFLKISHPSHVSEVMWLGDVQTCGCGEGQGCISVTCGCLCIRRVVPIMDAFFPSPFLPLFFLLLFYSFICFFCSRTNQGTLHWHGDQS